MESASKSATWTCPRCHLETNDFPAITRRNVGYAENSKICSNCGELEALVDWADDITSMIHWEFSFHQMCCGNATQDGHDEFHKFLAFRKLVGKHDPPLWKIEWLIWEKMFGSTQPCFSFLLHAHTKVCDGCVNLEVFNVVSFQ